VCKLLAKIIFSGSEFSLVRTRTCRNCSSQPSSLLRLSLLLFLLLLLLLVLVLVILLLHPPAPVKRRRLNYATATPTVAPCAPLSRANAAIRAEALKNLDSTFVFSTSLQALIDALEQGTLCDTWSSVWLQTGSCSFHKRMARHPHNFGGF